MMAMKKEGEDCSAEGQKAMVTIQQVFDCSTEEQKAMAMTKGGEDGTQDYNKILLTTEMKDKVKYLNVVADREKSYPYQFQSIGCGKMNV